MSDYTLVHVAISLVAIVSGIVVLGGMLAGNRLDRWTALFLVTTVATSVTGFFYFPFDGFTPAQAFGIISMILLGLSIHGRYFRHLEGAWCRVYVITAVAALYLNFLVGIVQSFEKIPPLKILAPTQSAPPFIIAQSIALLVFLVAGFFAVKRFRSEWLSARILINGATGSGVQWAASFAAAETAAGRRRSGTKINAPKNRRDIR